MFKLVHLRTYPPPLVLTPSGDHQNTYGWQVGGTYPTGMLSGSRPICSHFGIFNNSSSDIRNVSTTLHNTH